MKVDDKKPVEPLNAESLLQKARAFAKSVEKKLSTEDAEASEKKDSDTVRVRSYPDLDPKSIEAERAEKVAQIKKLIEEGGVERYLNTVSLSSLVDGLDREVDTTRYLFDLAGEDID